MTKQQLAINTLKNSSAPKLCDLWEELDKKEMNQEVATVRGWIMDALESKNQVSFDNWVESLDDSPRAHFQ